MKYLANTQTEHFAGEKERENETYVTNMLFHFATFETHSANVRFARK